MKAIQMCINRFDDETDSLTFIQYADAVNTDFGESETAPKEDIDLNLHSLTFIQRLMQMASILISVKVKLHTKEDIDKAALQV